MALVENCALEQVHTIERETSKVIRYALLINNAPWLCFVIPLILLIVFANRTTTFIKRAASLPENELDRLTAINNPLQI
jgi:hypothetical protein